MNEIRIGPAAQAAFLLALLAAAAVVVVGGLPELRRYLNIRSM